MKYIFANAHFFCYDKLTRKWILNIASISANFHYLSGTQPPENIWFKLLPFNDMTSSEACSLGHQPRQGFRTEIVPCFKEINFHWKKMKIQNTSYFKALDTIG